MSTTTSWFGFNQVTDGFAGIWGSKSNSKVDNSSVAYDDLTTGSQSWFRHYWWGGTIPSSSTVDSIEVYVRGYITTSSTYDDTQSARFRVAFTWSGSTLLSSSTLPSSVPPYVNEGAAMEYTKSKSRSSWGLSNADALELCNGTSSTYPLCVGATNSSGDTERFNIAYVKMRVTYTPPPGNVGMLVGNPGG